MICDCQISRSIEMHSFSRCGSRATWIPAQATSACYASRRPPRCLASLARCRLAAQRSAHSIARGLFARKMAMNGRSTTTNGERGEKSPAGHFLPPRRACRSRFAQLREFFGRFRRVRLFFRLLAVRLIAGDDVPRKHGLRHRCGRDEPHQRAKPPRAHSSIRAGMEPTHCPPAARKTASPPGEHLTTTPSIVTLRFCNVIAIAKFLSKPRPLVAAFGQIPNSSRSPLPSAHTGRAGRLDADQARSSALSP